MVFGSGDVKARIGTASRGTINSLIGESTRASRGASRWLTKSYGSSFAVACGLSNTDCYMRRFSYDYSLVN